MGAPRTAGDAPHDAAGAPLEPARAAGSVRARHRSSVPFLDRPRTDLQCALGWCVALALLVVIVRLLHGPASGDATESTFSAWAIAHGALACAFPRSNTIAPLYPLLTGVLAALLRIGAATPFPSASALGAHCAHGASTIGTWWSASGAGPSTLRLGYLGGAALLVGAVAVVRVVGRGRTNAELATVLVLAVAPPVFDCLQEFFHPQDLLATGLVLVAIALRGRWVAVGVVLGLALLAQQLAVLAVVPLVVAAPPQGRWRLGAGLLGTVAAVTVALYAPTDGGIVRAVAVGTGDLASSGGTWLYETGLHGAPQFVVARLVPIALALAVSLVVAGRLGERRTEPTVLVALVAVATSLRLVFEINLYGYYFVALAALLVLSALTAPRLRVAVLAWLVLVTVAFPPRPYGNDISPWLLSVLAWQVLLAATGVALACAALAAATRSSGATDVPARA